MTALLEAAPPVRETPHRTAELDHQEIELRAYFHYLDRGCADGAALEDWLAAETELREETQSTGSPA